jgi:hypothetical protein
MNIGAEKLRIILGIPSIGHEQSVGGDSESGYGAHHSRFTWTRVGHAVASALLRTSLRRIAGGYNAKTGSGCESGITKCGDQKR